MKQKAFFMLALLCAIAQVAWAWDGDGTSADPYQIKSSADWKQLADDVNGGNSYSGKYFEMTADIDAEGISVGNESKPFSGIFSGGMYTLTYDRGGAKPDRFEYADDYCAPFIRLDGATIRHLKVKGSIFSRHKYAAGIASLIDGSRTTTIDDCHVSSRLFADSNLDSDATFGGLVAVVESTCTASPVIKNSSFIGGFSGWSNRSSGLVGYTNLPIDFKHCMVDPKETPYYDDCATFDRTVAGVTCTFEECYYTQLMGGEQGVAVFREVLVSDGCEAEIISEPTIDFGGEKYWQNGAVIQLSISDDANFNHWETNGSCYIKDPWQRNGTHVISDLSRKPMFSPLDYMVKPSDERVMDGTKYRYLSRRDYHLYLSNEVCQQKGYQFDKNDDLFKWDADGNKVWVTAVVGWVPGDIPSDGAQIHNDLTGVGRDHTLVGCIAPHAFQGCTELKTLYFKDTDASTKNASFPFDFVIGDQAFAYCSNLTEIKMMQYTTKGDNHWEALKDVQVTEVSSNVFYNSPQANFTVDASEYQNYLSNKAWKGVNNRIFIYNHTNVDMDVNGVRYSEMRNTKGESLKNNAEGHAQLMETLKYWNADYQQFNASSLLSTSDKNIWYTKVVGVDAGSLSNGTMRIYNDPGSYYNYKTIALESLGQSKDVKNIEFWQTNGRSENSYNDLKIVIRNGALKGCTNLKELRMYYYVQDGSDNWETLGPQDVIPGDNIFGLPSDVDMKTLKTSELNDAIKASLPEDFKIIVSPDRYQEFLDDPNWMIYADFIQPEDFVPEKQQMNDFQLDGLTYGYMTSPGGILQTSQTVSQDVSWWTVPRIALEVALFAMEVEDAFKAVKALKEPFETYMTDMTKLKTLCETDIQSRTQNLWDDLLDSPVKKYLPNLMGNEAEGISPVKGVYGLMYSTYTKKVQVGLEEKIMDVSFPLITEQGEFVSSESMHTFLAMTAVNETQSFVGKNPVINLCIKQIADAAYTAAEKIVAPQLPSVLKQSAYYIGGQALAGTVSTAGIIATSCWGGSGTYDGEALRKGMRENILSNIHQVGMVGGGYIITTPTKNLCYHTYIKSVPDQEEVTIYAGTGKGQGRNNNARTMTWAKDAFHNKKNLKTIKFYENTIESDEAIPMLLTIPDSAFVGCTNLTTIDLRVQTKKNGTQALGPESFILAGDHVFANVDSTKIRIIIDPTRKQDFLDSESWAPMKQWFVYEPAAPETQYQEYGGNYAYAYENGTTQKVHKVSGHKIEHTIVTGADNKFLEEHQGGLKLCNDIGVYNNFQLDAVARKAFYGNKNLKVVNFTDLKGTGAFGDSYTGLDVTLEDSCFSYSGLEYLDMLYLVTDGDNHSVPIKPQQVKLGRGVLEGTNAKIRMMPQQVAWFEADTSWVKYKDRFMPCIIQPSDKGFKAALEDQPYYDRAHTGYDPATWDDYIDLSRRKGEDFPLLNGRFTAQKDDILSLADLQHFEGVKLITIYPEWFKGLSKLTNVVLPPSLNMIMERAFMDCSSLQEIELPSMLTLIDDNAFSGCTSLKTIRVRNPKPFYLCDDVFPRNEGMKIYVPAQSLKTYLKEWSQYKDYIVSDADYHVNKVVTVSKPNELAEKLGLFVEMSYSGLFFGDEPRYVHGNYAKYDSLTVSGPLGNVDLAVIRYLAGSDAYTGGGKPTDGCLRYLNLYNADIKETDDGYHYYNDEHAMVGTRYNIKNDNELPTYLFMGCTALETVVLPKSLTKIDARVFAGCSGLKRVAITGAVKEYDSWQYTDGLFDYPLEELVFLTDQYAKTSSNDPWGVSLQQIYTLPSQIGDYMNDYGIISQASAVDAPFIDDRAMKLLALQNEFFPSVYLTRESVEGIFNRSSLQDFDDFYNFQNVKRLENTFQGSGDLRRITLPASVEYIGTSAFADCGKLDTIRVFGIQPAELAEDAFRDLPSNFRIFVPRRYAKLYRTKWAQYADHINADDDNANRDILTVVVKEPNTLGKALGLEITTHEEVGSSMKYLVGVRGDYSRIFRLKVVGPIGGVDIDLMKYLAGYCCWTQSRNYVGRLEYLDLYDAQIKKTDESSAVWGEYRRWDGSLTPMGYAVKDNLLPQHSFLRAHSLKTLILPKTCKEVGRRALQECESLETLVIGDDMEDFNWSALDDDAMLSRMYILAKKKIAISSDHPIWRLLCNNYNPTFDAFYVRPTQYRNYLLDEAFTGSSWQRTNNVSTGVFNDDDSFCAFASHGAATQDELSEITSVRGWFDFNTGVRNLAPLSFTRIVYMDKATLAPLKELEHISMPLSLCEMEEGLFDANRHLRSVDFLRCDSTDVISTLRDGGFAKYGINTQQTLAYVPATYGNTDETNVVVASGDILRTKTYRLADSLSYVVPYEFEAEKIENSRTLAASAIPYTLCVPYKMNVPQYSRAYKLSERDGNSLVFTEVKGELEPMQPYLLKVVGNKRFRKMSTTLNSGIAQTIPASGGDTYGRQVDAVGYTLRGTFDAISNEEAADMGAYILQSDGDWHPVSTDDSKASILPFRAFLLPSARHASTRISMMLDDDTTDIDSIETIDEDGTHRYYDLNGRELPGKPDKGIYIYNGKMYINK